MVDEEFEDRLVDEEEVLSESDEFETSGVNTGQEGYVSDGLP